MPKYRRRTSVFDDFLKGWTGMSQAALSLSKAKFYMAKAGEIGKPTGAERAFATGSGGVPEGEYADPEMAIPEDQPTPSDTTKSAAVGGATAAIADPDDPGGDTGDNEDEEPGHVDHMAYLVGKGMDPKLAAALVGNARVESRMDPAATGDHGHSMGLYQFNANGRLPAFEQWAQENQRDPNTADAQHDFVLHDLQTNYPKVYTAMEDAPDARTAAEIFMRGYERPAAPTANLEGRQAQADDAFNSWQPQQQSQDTGADTGGALDLG